MEHEEFRRLYLNEIPEEGGLYAEAVLVINQSGRASVSLLQRQLLIGYDRAKALLDLYKLRTRKR